jgi:indian hedgehog protein
MFFSVILFVLILLFGDLNGQYPSDTVCNCVSVSTTGNVCMQYTCVTTPRRPTCFPGRSLVRIKDGSEKSLSNLNIGDDVLVLNNDNQLIYEPIIGFIHMKRTGLYEFLSIKIKTTSLYISTNHLIFLDNGTTVFAGELRRDDRIQYFYGNELIFTEIESIYLTNEEGYYAPLTPSGTIIIDNVLVSNYATISDHYLAHSVMRIYRWWIYLFGSMENNENIHWILKSFGIIEQYRQILSV